MAERAEQTSGSLSGASSGTSPGEYRLSLPSPEVARLQGKLAREREARLACESRLRATTDELKLRCAEYEALRTSVATPIQEAKTYLSVLLASLPFGVLVQDREGRIVLVNQSFCDLFGLRQRPSALAGMDWRGADQNARGLYVEPELYSGRLAEIRRARRTVVGDELTLRSGVTVERDYVPISISGAPRGELFLFRDTTEEKKRHDDLLSARDAAEEGNRAKATFLASMSHEMRTPLSAILGMADLLSDLPLSGEALGFASRISSNAEALRLLIEDILDFSKLEAGQIRLAENVFSPAELVESVTERLETTAKEQGLVLVSRVSEPPPVHVGGDEGRVAQLLANLASNAIKFTSSGSVTISCAPAAELGPGAVRYSVQDTGEGISQKDQSRIFQRFYRASSNVPGTGLGLSICQHLVELMGGSISVESEVGQGSLFVVTIPHQVAAKPEASESKLLRLGTVSPERLGPYVLLAEDDEDNRGLLKRFLERGGYRVDVAQDGQVARGKLMQRSYDALVSDLSMPHLDGFGLLSWLREREVGTDSRLPVLVVSAHALPEHQSSAMTAGADAFMTKPIKEGKLIANLMGITNAEQTILVVDDAEDSRVLLDRYLGSLETPVRILCASSGAEALEIFGAESVDLILLDVVMPGMDGVAVAKAVRSLPQGRSVPILGCTGHTEETELELCRQAGFTDFVSKPLRKGELLSKVRHELGYATEEPAPSVAEEGGETIVVLVSPDIEDLVPDFLARRRAEIEKIPELLKTGSWKELERIGHGMKGTGGAYGFDPISEIGARLELCAKSEGGEGIARCARELELYLTRVRVQVAPPR